MVPFPTRYFFNTYEQRKSVNILPVPVIESCWLHATLSGYSVEMHHVTISATLSIASFIGYCKFAQDTGSKFIPQHSSIVLLNTNTDAVLSELHSSKMPIGRQIEQGKLGAVHNGKITLAQKITFNSQQGGLSLLIHITGLTSIKCAQRQTKNYYCISNASV